MREGFWIHVKSAIFVLLLLLGAFFVIAPGTLVADQSGDYTYTVSDGNATITGYDGIGGAITIPSTLGGHPVVAIGDIGFFGDSLTSVIIPDGVTMIGYQSFMNCHDLATVSIPGSVTSIGEGAFSNDGLTTVVIPSSVRTIGESAFHGNVHLASITISDGVASIGRLAFADDRSLTSVSIPSSLTFIGEAAFQGCLGLNSLNVDANNLNYTSIDNVLYNKTLTTLIKCANGKTGALAIPSTVTSIGYVACNTCKNLTSVSFPSGLISIGDYAFDYCISLTSLTIPGNVTTIGIGAFGFCSGVTSIRFLGLVAPINVGVNWLSNDAANIEGHAYPASNFPAPGIRWNGLMMGAAISTNPAAPGAPTGLVADGGAGYVLLSWTAPVETGNPALTRYDVYRGTSSGSYGSPIGNVGASALTYNDTTAVPGTPYFYVVKAVNSVGPSLPSNEVTGTATSGPQAPSAPQNLAATSGNNSVVLSWTAPANAGNPAFTSYDIYRGATAGSIGTTPIGSVAAGTLTYNDNTAMNGNTYVYVIKAVNPVGSSPASNSAQGNPSSTPSNNGAGNYDLLIVGAIVLIIILIGAFWYMRSRKTPPKSS